MSDTLLFQPDQVHYILRLYLPLWNYDAILKDVIAYCEQTGTRHVMLFTDAQHMVWNQLTLSEAREEAAGIARAVRELAPHGIKVGINSSYNMMMSRFDHRNHTPQYQHYVVLADGTSEYRTPCLLDPALKEYLHDYYRILAGTGAEYIYVDDDHRYVFTGKNNTWGCMCQLHLAGFSSRTGRNWTREALQKALFDTPSVRGEWIEMLHESLQDLATVIEQAVHSVNARTKVGLMVPCLHIGSVVNYQLPDMAKRLQPRGKALLRPSIGPYSDRDRLQIIPGLFYMEMIGHIMGDRAEYTPEIETTPFSRFSKSMEVVCFHIAQGIVNGMPNPAISACGYVGNSPFFEPEIARMLSRRRPYFEALLKIVPHRSTRKGIGLCFDVAAAKSSKNCSRHEVSDFYLPAFTVHDFLCNSGFAVTYEPGTVTFLAGDTVYSFSDERIKTLLSGNLICDADAAEALTARGFGAFLGCEVGATPDFFGAEYFMDPEFCGVYQGSYTPLKDTPLDDVKSLRATHPQARTVSKITDHDRRELCDAMVLFTNDLGGKVAVMNYRIGPITYDMRHLISYQKRHLMQRIINWMSPEALPAFVNEPTGVALQYFDDGEYAFIGLANTSYDTFDSFNLHLEDSSLDVAHGEYLDEDGKLRPLSAVIVKNEVKNWDIARRLPIFHYFALRIPHKK